MKYLEDISKEKKLQLIDWLKEDKSTCLESDHSVGIYPDYELACAFQDLIQIIEDTID